VRRQQDQCFWKVALGVEENGWSEGYFRKIQTRGSSCQYAWEALGWTYLSIREYLHNRSISEMISNTARRVGVVNVEPAAPDLDSHVLISEKALRKILLLH
jgi:hypothetical protein